MPLIIFGIGSNLGNKTENIQKAKELLIKEFEVKNFLSSASNYKSEALVQDKAIKEIKNFEYLNSAIAFNLNLEPFDILKKIKNIEVSIGRKKRPKWHPREIDIDILIYEENEMKSEILNIPHAELENRDFALLPLIEILQNLKKESKYYEKILLTANSNKCLKI